MAGTKMITNSMREQGAASRILGDATASAVGGVTKGVGELGNVAGRAVGEAVGGIIDGFVQGGTKIYELIGGPSDPELRKVWFAQKQQRAQQRAAFKQEVALAKQMAPLNNAMAMVRALKDSGLMGDMTPQANTGLTAEQVAEIAAAAAKKAVAEASGLK